MTEVTRARLKQNLDQVHERIAAATLRAGRDPQSIKLVAITKYVDAQTAGWLAELGCREIGESRPQTLWEKAETLENPAIRWHLVGPLQRNKIRRTLPYATLIHSVDSDRLAQAIDRIAQELGRVADILLEVNVSGEPSKQGLEPDLVEPTLNQIAQLAAVRVLGLMCMSGLHSDDSAKQKQFESLRELRDRLQLRVPQGSTLGELSMGMSDDFELAISAGATLLRVGSILFG